MKKWKRATSLLLSLTILLSLCMVGASATVLETDVASIGDTGYATLSEALTAANEGNTIKLLSDMTLSANFGINKDVTLDLNGKTLTIDKKLNTNGSVTITDAAATKGKITGAGYISVNTGSSLALTNCVVDCEASGYTIYVYDSISITNSTITHAGTGDAVRFAWNCAADAELTLGAGNTITGAVAVVANGTSAYHVTIAGGAFDGALYNPNSAGGLAKMKECLTITGGTFSTDVSDFAGSDYKCVKSDGKYLIQEKSSEEKTSVAYTVSTDETKTYHATFAEALTAAGDAGTVYMLSSVTPTADELTAMDGKTIRGVNVAALTYSGTLGAFLTATDAATLSSIKLVCTDVTITDATTAGGKLTAGTLLSAENYAACQDYLADGMLIDGMSYIVDSADQSNVKIGNLGYFYLSDALDAAAANDNTGSKIKDEIVLLKDVRQGSESHANACYTIDLNGHSMTGTGTGSSGFSIAPTATGANITLKNGSISGYEFGVYQNGTTSGTTLTLEDVTVTAGDTENGAGVYFPGQESTLNIEGDTTISGAIGLGVKGGTVNIGDGAVISGTRATAVNPTAPYSGPTGGINTSSGSAVYVEGGYGYTTEVTITGGKFSSRAGDTVSMVAGADHPSIVISGGYFTDNSAITYLGTDYKMISDPSVAGYSYQVVAKGTDDAKVVAPAASGSKAVEIPAGTSEAATSAINTAADQVAGTAPVIETPQALIGITNSDNAATTVPEQSSTEKESNASALNNLDNQIGATADNVTLVVQPVVNVEVSGVELDSSNNVTAIEVNIDATYKTLVTTSTIAEGTNPIVAGTNAIEVTGAGTSGSLTVNTPVTLSIAIPDALAASGTLMVKHIKNGNVHYHEGTVSGTAGNYKLTFTTTDGFSPFVISAADQRVLTINGINYTISDVSAALPTATQSGSSFNGWTFAGISGTYTSLSNDLWNALNGSVALTSTTPTVITATASFTFNGGGSAAATYSVTVSSATNGVVKSGITKAAKGTTVTLTVAPAGGYVLDALTVKDAGGNVIATTKASNTTYTFTMPASAVTVSASFTVGEAALPFTDVAADHWAYAQIAWAYTSGYMNGKSETTFVPTGTVTRQQLWMVLARMSGETPADMAAAKDWAVANGISDGADPANPVSRQQMVTILYRYAALKGYDVTGTGSLAAFQDGGAVASYATDAMTWAVGSGIVGGAAGKLNPTGATTRAQFAVILNRFCNTVVQEA